MANHLTPVDELVGVFAQYSAHRGLDPGVRELRVWAELAYDRLTDKLLTHRQAAEMLGVSIATLHNHRDRGRIRGFTKNPKSSRKTYIYRLGDVLEYKVSRSHLRS